jgi:phage I-like protein
VSKQQGQQVKTASLVFQLGVGEADAEGLAQVTTEAHLLPPGPFRSTDVRPVECKAWQLDTAIAARVIARAAALKNDFLIDYEHQSLRSAANGQPVPAAGWFKTFEWRESGLWATGIDWTAEGKERIAEKEYRYISAVFTYYADTGEVLEIVSVALTNTPGIDGLDPLTQRAAMSRSAFLTIPSKSTKDDDMDKDQQIAALTAERDALKPQAEQVVQANAKVVALTTERDTLKTERDTAQTALTALKEAQDKDKHATLLTAALTDGRLAPAQKAWAEKQSLAALTEYLDATASLVQQDRQAGASDKGGHGLNEVELATCTRMGVSPEAYVAARDNKPLTKSA